MQFQRPLEVSPRLVGPPRLDPYQRLLARFYEQLFLLKALGQTRGPHTSCPPHSESHQEQRRAFLQNLSYICDFKKGGSTCTAIALENTQTNYTFWVASNGESDQIAGFLKEVLSVLRRATRLTGPEITGEEVYLTSLCAQISASRIHKEKISLRRNVKDCLLKLNKAEECSNTRLVSWLETLLRLDENIQLCSFAYESRHSSYIRTLKGLATAEERRLSPTAKRSSFYLVQHYIGRLGHHIRAAKHLIRDSSAMSYLLETYEVGEVEPSSSIPPPRRDSQTNLRGILNRMMKDNDKEKAVIEKILCHMDHVSGSDIFNDFLSQYNHATVQVHAEVQVLEHFDRKQLSFVGDDRFIACSKPACFCCQMYFNYHPARVVLSSSHLKIWERWSPPLVLGYDSKSSEGKKQRDILNKMTQELREQVIRQVLKHSKPRRWHPDSKTGITDTNPCASGYGFPRVFESEQANTLAPVAREFEQHDATSKPAVATFNKTVREIVNDDAFDSDNGGVSIYT